jgi:hypothetical protein
VSVDFGDIEPDSQPGPEEHHFEQLSSIEQKDTAETVPVSTDTQAVNACQVVNVSVEEVAASENTSIVPSASCMEMHPEGYTASITDAIDIVLDTEVSMPEQPNITPRIRQDRSRSSSPLKTRSHAGSCCRSSTPPFRSAVDGKNSIVEHAQGRCLHVEMPPPTARVMMEADMDLDERINHVVSDPTSDVFWAVKSLSPEAIRVVSTPEVILSNSTAENGLSVTKKSESKTAEKPKSDTPRKRTGSCDTFGPPKMTVAGNSLEKMTSTACAKTVTHGLKQQLKKTSSSHESKSVAPPTATKKKTSKLMTDNSLFAKALSSGTTQPKTHSQKPVKSQPSSKENSECRKLSDSSQKTLQNHHGTSKVQTKVKSKNTVLQCSIFNQQDINKVFQSSVTSNSGSLKKIKDTVVKVNSSQSPTNGAITKQPNLTTPVSSTKEDSALPRSLATADSVSSATATSAMSAHTGFGDPYTWACMFGAMTAGMNFFSVQAPRWPGPQSVQSEATPAVGDQLAAPQPQGPPF